MLDDIGANDAIHAVATSAPGDKLTADGQFHAVFTDNLGTVLHEETYDNIFTTLGKNALLDNTYATPASLVGPFMGLISSASFSAVAAADTMASHAGWLEANATNAPNYTGARQTAAFNAASAGVKAMSAGLAFVFTNSGTVQGSFLVSGSGAVSTNTSTAGSLTNAGTLAAPQPVISGNTLTLTWTGTIT